MAPPQQGIRQLHDRIAADGQVVVRQFGVAGVLVKLGGGGVNPPTGQRYFKAFHHG